MKIRALRVAECGRFTSPVALENLSGGLDVLAGVNELGKSTLLRALDLALREKHTANKIEIVAAPTVAAPRRWRSISRRPGDAGGLNKQFLVGQVGPARRSRQRHLGSQPGSRGASGADPGRCRRRGRFSLLWVKQRSGFEPKDVDDKQAPSAAGGHRRGSGDDRRR